MSRLVDRARHLGNRLAAGFSLGLRGERPSLVTFLVHAVFEDEREARTGQVDPQQAVTVADLDRLLGYFRGHGYRFLSPADLADGPDPEGRWALLTFDDGYANNLRALPVLEKHAAPAVFFVSANHVRRNRAFWWDVVYRERRARGTALPAIGREQQALKSHCHAELRDRLIGAFGETALAPRGDLDRPLTPAELARLAAHPLAWVGNHTMDHAILTIESPRERRAQIEDAQATLAELAGSAPTMIAYPDGAYDADVIAAAAAAGLRFGITVEPRKNRLPIAPASDDALRLGRFVPWGAGSLRGQLDVFRSDIRPFDLAPEPY